LLYADNFFHIFLNLPTIPMKNQRFRNMLCSILLCSILAIGLSSCFTQKIVVGNGASSQSEETTKAWFFVFGLIPGQGPIDLDKMAKGASNYTVVYEENIIDGLISVITLNLVTPRTVTVKR
jgi:hypothetical protein